MKYVRYIVDRIEEQIAVCEDATDGKSVRIPLCKLPLGVREGDVITDDYTLDHAQTLERKNRASKRLQALKMRNNKKNSPPF